jgi:hypothetical protein
MKNKGILFLLLSGLLLASSCKKYVQRQETNALISIMTSGVWMVTHYADSGTDITSNFSGYTFQFYANGTVDAIKAGMAQPGTWVGNINAHTITSNFPAAGSPLDKLNAVWTITDSYTDSVSANCVIGTDTNYLSLKKQ